MNNASGKIGEDCAAQLLIKKGYRVVARNYRSRFGEIDIIAENKEYIVFAEVKTRDEHYTVSPLEAVTAGKQKKIVKTALFYLQSNRTVLQPRFDVIGIITATDQFTILSVEHIENAFSGGQFH
nr:YraN family protein [uncultured Caproiciproducens sp.]